MKASKKLTYNNHQVALKIQIFFLFFLSIKRIMRTTLWIKDEMVQYEPFQIFSTLCEQNCAIQNYNEPW
jgi:hypothetical protein